MAKKARLELDQKAIDKFMRESEQVKNAMEEIGEVVAARTRLGIENEYFSENVKSYVPQNSRTVQVAIIRIGGGHPGQQTAALYESKYKPLQRAVGEGLS